MTITVPETPFDLCERRWVDLKTMEPGGRCGITPTLAWTHGRFAAHKLIDGELFTISNIASGGSLLGIGAIFDVLECAVEAMIEIEANFIGPKPTNEEAMAFFEICVKHRSKIRTKEELKQFTFLRFAKQEAVKNAVRN
jgi:hypothetical protein